VLEYLKEYIKRTTVLRGEQSKLFVSFVKPHKAVTKDTIARWVKSILQQSGIDTDKFTCHSTRAASTSCVKAAGLNLKQIMQSAGWSNSSTFESSMINILKLKILVQQFSTQQMLKQ
jgi:site-specific recombinase XerD